MRLVRRLAAAVLVLLLAAPRSALSQERGAVALEQAMRGLTVTSRVLIIGAHPDDEDTQLIAWLARGRGVETDVARDRTGTSTGTVHTPVDGACSHSGARFCARQNLVTCAS